MIKSAMANSPSASLSSSTQVQNKPYVTKRISFNDGQKTTTSFAKAAPPPQQQQPSIKAKEILPGKVTLPQEERYGAPRGGEVDDEEDDEEEEEEEESRWAGTVSSFFVFPRLNLVDSMILSLNLQCKRTPRVHAYVMNTRYFMHF